MSFYESAVARGKRKNQILPNQTAAPSPDSPDFGQLAEAVEKAIKAALIESHGSLPQQHDHDKLVSICQSTGVWDVLPPALRGLIKEVDAYRSTSSRPNSQASVESSREQIQNTYYIYNDYMEFHVIGNDSRKAPQGSGDIPSTEL
jgi:hypothetical protein